MQDAVNINQLVEYPYDALMIKQNWHACQDLASTAPVLLLSYVSTVSRNTVIILQEKRREYSWEIILNSPLRLKPSLWAN